MATKNTELMGAMVELSPELIDEGKFIRRLGAALLEAHESLKRYEKQTESAGGKVVVNAKIELNRDQDMKGLLSVITTISIRVPSPSYASYAKEAGGRMLTQPGGSSADAPDQQKLFDPTGKPMGVLDRQTGEIREEKPEPSAVAGRIATG